MLYETKAFCHILLIEIFSCEMFLIAYIFNEIWKQLFLIGRGLGFNKSPPLIILSSYLIDKQPVKTIYL